MRRVVVLAVAACGGKAGPVPVVEPAAPALPPRPPACIAVPEDAATVTMATSVGSRISYCVGSPDQCFAFDLSANTLEHVVEPPPAAVRAARVKMTSPSLEVCLSETCKALTTNVLPNAATLRAATNAAGTVAVVLLGDPTKGDGYAEVWDVTKSRRSAMFRYARGDFRCGDVAMLDETIYISAASCGTPAARGALYTQRGRKIANVGGRDFGVFGNALAQLDGPTWAFLEESGAQIAIQDILKGKVKKTIDTTAVFKERGAEMGNPGESALVKLADGKLALIAGAPATGTIAIVDTETGALELKHAPLCAAE